MATLRRGLVQLNDFTGGLNLRADQFQLDPSESPDMLNVEVDPRGGIALRRGISPLNATALANTPLAVWDYQNDAGTKQVLVQHGTKIAYSTGANFTDLAGITQTVSDRCTAATFADVNYIVNGTDGTVKWDGSTASRLGTSWANDLSAPTGGNMPKAHCVAYHMGLLWTANTFEDGVNRPNRVRWSHPNKPEDWRQIDFIDVSPGADGDEIVSIVSFFDRLLVFKRRSVHAIYGFSPENFQVQPITDAAGAVNAESIAQSPEAIYFYSWPDGVWRYNGKNLEWLYAKLYPAFQLGSIQDTRQDEIRLGFAARKLWCSVPWGSATDQRTFVYDPSVGKKGAWSAHDLKIGKVHEWKPTQADTIALAVLTAGAASKRLVKLEQEKGTDDYGSGDVHIDSYYVSAWSAAGNAIADKRWRRLRMVADTDIEAHLTVDVYHEYDRSNVKVSGVYHYGGIPSGALAWGGVGLTWGAAGLTWSETSGRLDEVVKGIALGRAKSIQLRIKGPSENARWQVHLLSVPFIEKQVR